jgi:hypothetical protein
MDASRSPRPRTRQRKRERRARWRHRAVRWGGGVIVIGAVFFCGLAVGLAIRDNNKGGDGQTLVRTLVPTTISPAQTVTVTVSNP